MKKNRSNKQLFSWSAADKKTLRGFNSPEKIQAFLDKCRYNKSSKLYSPSEVLNDQCAHCFDGAIFAASVLNYFGETPLILDLCAIEDDDHIITIFKNGAYFGAIAKSNYSGLRYREAIFKNERELVLSYFEGYFNIKAEKTLRSYSKAFNLLKVSKIDWKKTNNVYEQIVTALNHVKHYPIIPKGAGRRISKVDSRSYKAGLVGAL